MPKISEPMKLHAEADHLVIATGRSFMPTFENDDVPGVYNAAVVQKMMNQEFTLLGKNVLTELKYRVSYQLPNDAGKAKVGYRGHALRGWIPVQANGAQVGHSIMLSKILQAIPNKDRTVLWEKYLIVKILRPSRQSK